MGSGLHSSNALSDVPPGPSELGAPPERQLELLEALVRQELEDGEGISASPTAD